MIWKIRAVVKQLHLLRTLVNKQSSAGTIPSSRQPLFTSKLYSIYQHKANSQFLDDLCTLIGLPHRIRALPSWMARAASPCELYLTNPKPLSRCTRTSSITPAPNAWKCLWSSAELTCNSNSKQDKTESNQSTQNHVYPTYILDYTKTVHS